MNVKNLIKLKFLYWVLAFLGTYMQRLLIPFAKVFLRPFSSFSLSSSCFSCSSSTLDPSLFLDLVLELGLLPTHMASGSRGMSAVNLGGWCMSRGRLDITAHFGDGLLLYLWTTAAFLKIDSSHIDQLHSTNKSQAELTVLLLI